MTWYEVHLRIEAADEDDHPFMWDWPTLLGCQAEIIEAIEVPA